MKTNDTILQTITKAIVFIILAFSVFIFFAGHNNPGGGFIGGLMTAAAIVLLMLAFDLDTVKKVIPIDYKKMIAVGLIFAVGTGVGALFFDAPFLTHAHGYQELWFLGKTHLATALLFDIGVYLVVIGVTLTIMQTIGEDE